MNSNKRIVAVTGLIGSGKSVVCSILKALGHEVYDCDSRAKILMDRDSRIIMAIGERVSAQAVNEGIINRRILAEVVFSDPQLLKELNGIVHAAVREDFVEWSLKKDIAFMETAILYTSGMAGLVSEVWNVTAPESLRIERIARRNSDLSLSQIKKRIDSQASEANPSSPHPRVFSIVNDGISPVLPRVEELLGFI